MSDTGSQDRVLPGSCSAVLGGGTEHVYLPARRAGVAQGCDEIWPLFPTNPPTVSITNGEPGECLVMSRRDVEIRWHNVRLLALDFDGVLTDNHVYTNQRGEEMVRCWRGDGIGIRELQRNGVYVVVISGETNPVVTERCSKLGVPCERGVLDKVVALRRFCKPLDIGLTEVAYIGNDLNDLPALRAVGFPIVVPDADSSLCAAIQGMSGYMTKASGGCGAVREVCKMILGPQHDWESGGG